MEIRERNYFKPTLALLLCLLARMIPLRAPNVEPILATTMPISRAYGALVGFAFAVFSILLYDAITHTLGVHTFFTAGAYGIIGLWSASYFKTRKANRWSYVQFAIVGTLFFDAFTGLTVGPLLFHQSFYSAALGQIPFTLLHLIGNISFAIILSPAIYNFMIKKKKKRKLSAINALNPKII